MCCGTLPISDFIDSHVRFQGSYRRFLIGATLNDKIDIIPVPDFSPTCIPAYFLILTSPRISVLKDCMYDNRSLRSEYFACQNLGLGVNWPWDAKFSRWSSWVVLEILMGDSFFIAYLMEIWGSEFEVKNELLKSDIELHILAIKATTGL